MSVISIHCPWGRGRGRELRLRKMSLPWKLVLPAASRTWELLEAASSGSPSLACISKSLGTITGSSSSNGLCWDVGSEVSQKGGGVELLDLTSLAHPSSCCCCCNRGPWNPVQLAVPRLGLSRGRRKEALHLGNGVWSLGNWCGLTSPGLFSALGWVTVGAWEKNMV